MTLNACEVIKSLEENDGEYFLQSWHRQTFLQQKAKPTNYKRKNRNTEPTPNLKFLLLKKIPLKIKWRKYLQYMLQDLKEYKKNSYNLLLRHTKWAKV